MGTEYSLVDFANKEFIHLGKLLWDDEEEAYNEFQMPSKEITKWLVRKTGVLLTIISEFNQTEGYEECICKDHWHKYEYEERNK